VSDEGGIVKEGKLNNRSQIEELRDNTHKKVV
jgi:hypothetical protein